MAELLYKLRAWLSIPDAAAHLSIAFGQDVTEVEVLRLALEGQLTLSVNFINPAVGGLCKVVPQDLARTQYPGRFEGQQPNDMVGETAVEQGHVIELDPDVPPEHIYKVLDLAMIGSTTFTIEEQIQELTGGPIKTLGGGIGVFLKHPDGSWYQLLEGPHHLGAAGKWYPAGDLPDDAVLVVRSAALDYLKARVKKSSTEVSKPLAMDKSLGTRERRTLLTIIAALAKLADLDLSKPSKAAKVIESQTELFGERVANRTIENHLRNISDELK